METFIIYDFIYVLQPSSSRAQEAKRFPQLQQNFHDNEAPQTASSLNNLFATEA